MKQVHFSIILRPSHFSNGLPEAKRFVLFRFTGVTKFGHIRVLRAAFLAAAVIGN